MKQVENFALPCAGLGGQGQQIAGTDIGSVSGQQPGDNRQQTILVGGRHGQLPLPSGAFQPTQSEIRGDCHIVQKVLKPLHKPDLFDSLCSHISTSFSWRAVGTLSQRDKWTKKIALGIKTSIGIKA